MLPGQHKICQAEHIFACSLALMVMDVSVHNLFSYSCIWTRDYPANPCFKDAIIWACYWHSREEYKDDQYMLTMRLQIPNSAHLQTRPRCKQETNSTFKENTEVVESKCRALSLPKKQNDQPHAALWAFPMESLVHHKATGDATVSEPWITCSTAKRGNSCSHHRTRTQHW